MYGRGRSQPHTPPLTIARSETPRPDRCTDQMGGTLVGSSLAPRWHSDSDDTCSDSETGEQQQQAASQAAPRSLIKVPSGWRRGDRGGSMPREGTGRGDEEVYTAVSIGTRTRFHTTIRRRSEVA